MNNYEINSWNDAPVARGNSCEDTGIRNHSGLVPVWLWRTRLFWSPGFKQTQRKGRVLPKVCYQSCHILCVFLGLLLLPRWPTVVKLASYRRINSSTTSTEPGAVKQALSHSFLFSLSLCSSHFSSLQAQTKADTHARKYSHKHAHTYFVPKYVHDLTPLSKVYRHQACSRFSTHSTHRWIPSLYTPHTFTHTWKF